MPLEANQYLRLIMSTSQRIDNLGYYHLLKPLKLSVASYQILRVLEKYQALSPSELVKQLGSTKSNISQRLHSLEKRGLIHRTIDPNDHRSTRLELSPSGQQLLSGIAEKIQHAEIQLEKHFSPEELHNLQSFLHKLNTIFDNCH
jgi:DNA-binding MarR family transcriptional regulator